MPSYDEDIEIQNGHNLQLDHDATYNVKLKATMLLGGDPGLQIDRGVMALKDLNMYGFVGMTTDPQKVAGGSAILMGHGFISSTTPPRLSLTDSELVNQVLYSQEFLNSVWIGNPMARKRISQQVSNMSSTRHRTRRTLPANSRIAAKVGGVGAVTSRQVQACCKTKNTL